MNYQIPYDFVLSYLYPLRPQVRKLPAGYALFLEKKMLLLLRDNENRPEFNGVFVAVQSEFYQVIQAELHTSRMEFDIDGSVNSWIFLSEDLEDFDNKVRQACDMLKRGDPRVGRLT